MRKFKTLDIVEDKNGTEWLVNGHDTGMLTVLACNNEDGCKWFAEDELDHVMPDELVENEIKQIMHENL